jgi:hypothetical protein
MESPEDPKVVAHVEQASMLARFMVVSEVEFGGFFQEINGVGWHEKQTDDTDYPERGGYGGWIRSKHESPEHQERGEQRADGDKDQVETTE